MTMEQYLDKVSLERISEIRARLIRGKSTSDSHSDDIDESSLSEDNWELLMIHTSKRMDGDCPFGHFSRTATPVN